MEKHYIKTFQGLRWFACFMVFLSHSMSQLGIPVNFGAAFSVVVFFGLSGFLAQMKLVEREKNDSSILSECVKNYIHSAIKFYPLHWMVLLLILLPSILYGSDSPIIIALKLLLNATLLQCWIPNTSFAYSFNGVSWYLSVAMFFAFLSPLIVRGVSKLTWRGVSLCLVGILCLQIGFAFCSIPTLNLLIYVFPPIRILDCIAGCLLCRLSELFKEKNIKGRIVNSIFLLSAVLLIGAMLVVNLVKDPGWCGGLFRVAVWSVPAWGIVFSLSYEDKLLRCIKMIFANRVVVLLGGITFEFYLIHKEILNCGSEGFHLFFHREADFFMVIIAFAVSLGLSLIIYTLDKFLRKKWKDKKSKNSQAK